MFPLLGQAPAAYVHGETSMRPQDQPATRDRADRREHRVPLVGFPGGITLVASAFGSEPRLVTVESARAARGVLALQEARRLAARAPHALVAGVGGRRRKNIPLERQLELERGRGHTDNTRLPS